MHCPHMRQPKSGILIAFSIATRAAFRTPIARSSAGPSTDYRLPSTVDRLGDRDALVRIDEGHRDDGGVARAPLGLDAQLRAVFRELRGQPAVADVLLQP